MLDFFRRLFPPRFPPRLLWHRGRARFWAWREKFPGRAAEMKIFGVTGTDGKTTTCEMLAAILCFSGKKVALATTTSWDLGDSRSSPPTKKTSQDAREISRFLRRAREAGCDAAILETSSVALDQDRLFGVDFAGVGLTTLTPEELRYHGGWENYRAAKRLLFEKTPGAIHALPAGEEFADFAALPAGEVVSFGEEGKGSAGVQISSLQKEAEGISFLAGGEKFFLPLPGRHNASNATLAAILARAAGVSFEESARALASFRGVPGRLERVEDPRGRLIFVDYALTPDAFEKALAAVREELPPGGKLLHVFGATGGGRDREKRPQLGELSARLADFTILTDDESYDEKPEEIIAEVAAGIPAGAAFEKVPDRRAALRRALELARPGDAILATGMGSESTRNAGGREIPWREAEILAEEAREIPAA